MPRIMPDSPRQFIDEPAPQVQLRMEQAENLYKLEGNEYRRLKTLGEAVHFFATVDSGRLYFYCKDYGTTIYLKFKWDNGPWKDYYEWWTSDFSNIHDGLHGLMMKVLQVEAGERKPTYDKPYIPGSANK